MPCFAGEESAYLLFISKGRALWFRSCSGTKHRCVGDEKAPLHISRGACGFWKGGRATEVARRRCCRDQREEPAAGEAHRHGTCASGKQTPFIAGVAATKPHVATLRDGTTAREVQRIDMQGGGPALERTGWRSENHWVLGRPIGQCSGEEPPPRLQRRCPIDSGVSVRRNLRVQ